MTILGKFMIWILIVEGICLLHVLLIRQLMCIVQILLHFYINYKVMMDKSQKYYSIPKVIKY